MRFGTLVCAAGLILCSCTDPQADAEAASEAARIAAEERRAAAAARAKDLEGLLLETTPVAYLPAAPDASCEGRQVKIYDACSPQMEIYGLAMFEAAQSGKVALVVYGAEWCIWCHVFDQHLEGRHGEFRYNLEGQRTDYREPLMDIERSTVLALNAFAADNLLLTYVNADAADGEAVLERAGIDPETVEELPLIFALDNRGKAARVMSQQAVISRAGLFSSYIGYDRRKLLAELEAMAQIARDSGMVLGKSPV
jgi:hypothetical protein